MLWNLATKQKIATSNILETESIDYPKFSFPNKDVIMVHTNFDGKQFSLALDATTLKKLTPHQIAEKMPEEKKSDISSEEQIDESSRYKKKNFIQEGEWPQIQNQACNSEFNDPSYKLNSCYVLPDNQHMLFVINELKKLKYWIPRLSWYWCVPDLRDTYDYRQDHLVLYNKTTQQLTHTDFKADYIWNLDMDPEGKVVVCNTKNHEITFAHLDFEVMKQHREIRPTISNLLPFSRAVTNIVFSYLDIDQVLVDEVVKLPRQSKKTWYQDPKTIRLAAGGIGLGVAGYVAFSIFKGKPQPKAINANMLSSMRTWF